MLLCIWQAKALDPSQDGSYGRVGAPRLGSSRGRRRSFSSASGGRSAPAAAGEPLHWPATTAAKRACPPRRSHAVSGAPPRPFAHTCMTRRPPERARSRSATAAAARAAADRPAAPAHATSERSVLAATATPAPSGTTAASKRRYAPGISATAPRRAAPTYRFTTHASERPTTQAGALTGSRQAGRVGPGQQRASCNGTSGPSGTPTGRPPRPA